MESEKSKFEAERKQILSELPESIKATFGTIGFAAAEFDENEIIPVLIMSPYDVPPKPVRDVYWFDQYSKAKRSKSLDKLAYLVYHYGADDPDDCYSFIEQEDFISYEDGVRLGYDLLSAELEQKIKDAIELTEEEALRVRGLNELKEDVVKDPSLRKRGNAGFKERHEQTPKSVASAKATDAKQPPTKRQKK
jgi:hypothetical protein